MPSPWAQALMKPDATSDLFQIMARELRGAEERGHVLEPIVRDDKFEAAARCERCQLWLVVNSSPDPGDPYVEGTVAVTDCPGITGSAPSWALPVIQQ